MNLIFGRDPNSAKVHNWKKLQSIINPPKHNISKNNGRILFPSMWKKMKSTPTFKKWLFFKVRKKALVVVRSSKFKLNKKISLMIYNFYLYDIFRGPYEKCTCWCNVFLDHIYINQFSKCWFFAEFKKWHQFLCEDDRRSKIVTNKFVRLVY